MFITENTKSGQLTLRINGKYVHSRYDPISEAKSFLDKQSFKRKPYIFILIGPGLGYLKSSVTDTYPESKILSIHVEKKIYKLSLNIGLNWYYEEKKNLRTVLNNFVPDFQLTETAVIKWLPCTDLFPERTEAIEQIIQQFFLERKGTIFTTGSFGKKWIRNIYFNYISNRKLVSIKNINSTILIAASGPSLSSSFNLIKSNRKSFLLAALPSSLMALNNSGIIPDLIFHTDAGFWAKEHLKYIPNKSIPIIMPLNSSFDSNIENPLIFINQGSIIENLLINDRFLTIPPHGTVAGTAYLFFRKITKSPIIFLGLDFCSLDIISHVKPHSFDVLIDQKQNRNNGILNLLFERNNIFTNYNIKRNTSEAYTIYSGWFNDKSKISNSYRFNGSKIETKGLMDINSDDIIKLIGKNNNYFDIQKNYIDTNNTHTNFNINILLNKYLDLLEEFKSDINNYTEITIQKYFSQYSILIELMQYISYAEVLELSHYYRVDLKKSKNILFKIHMKCFTFISSFLGREQYE
jgi:hypothetical protein